MRTTLRTMLALVCLAGSAAAGTFDLSWFTIDCGGGTCAGGDFELSGTTGQPDAGVLTGGDFELVGGFWPAAELSEPDCLGDTNGDNVVDLTDLAIVISDYAKTGDVDGDLNGDGIVDLTDLAIVITEYGSSC